MDARKYMVMAIEVMDNSIQEPRSDKVSPKVGALLIKPTGEIETAFRGELRHGDHAEFTLLERKNRSTPLDGSILSRKRKNMLKLHNKKSHILFYPQKKKPSPMLYLKIYHSTILRYFSKRQS